MSDKQIPWIKKGYHTFAYGGPLSLKIERLASEVGKNKSSFYHLFANLEIFTNVLLRHHLEQSKIIAKKEASSTTLEELIEIIIYHKVDLLFNRQLRVHRENPDFEKCFCKSAEISLPGMIPIWSEIIGLKENSYLAELVLQLSLENFFLQITDETLNKEWLEAYFIKIRNMVSQFKQTGSVTALDGTV